MLPLDDPLWNKLRTTYSKPGTFLPSLKRLADDPTSADAVCEEFASNNYVCHQGGVFETTIAVVPYFIDAAARLAPAQRLRLLQNAGLWSILIANHLGAASADFDPPTVVLEDYKKCLPLAARLTAETFLMPHDEVDLLLLMSALAGFLGQNRVANLLNVSCGWLECRNCHAEFEPLHEWGEMR